MDTSEKYERVFKWDLTKDQVECYVGPLTDEQFKIFCENFETIFSGYYTQLLELYQEQWEWMCPWDDDAG